MKFTLTDGESKLEDLERGQCELVEIVEELTKNVIELPSLINAK